MLPARIVIDTNILVSAALFPGSSPRRAFRLARSHAKLLASVSTLAELQEVLQRPKFDKAGPVELRNLFFLEYARLCELVSTHTSIHACRHPKDNKFLELAVDGSADLILTGDNDLLSLHPFRGIPILSPTQYIEKAG